jgi:hypothetical protein
MTTHLEDVMSSSVGNIERCMLVGRDAQAETGKFVCTAPLTIYPPGYYQMEKT